LHPILPVLFVVASYRKSMPNARRPLIQVQNAIQL
jgi:hypothetical protein